MNRRTLLRGAALTLGGGAATAAGLSVAQEADAQATTELSVADDRAVLGADASVTAVWLDVTIEWAYDLPEGTQPSTVIVELLADETVVASADSAELFLEADGSESFEVDLLAEGVLNGDELAPVSGERATDVQVGSHLRVENADGEPLAEAAASDTAVVTVERDGFDASEYGSVGGSGELRIESE